MVDFGWIHNGLPRRVHAWFDVDPEESPGRQETAAAYLKAAGIAIRAPGGWGAARRQNRAACSGLPQTTPPLCLQTARRRHAGREQCAWQLIGMHNPPT